MVPDSMSVVVNPFYAKLRDTTTDTTDTTDTTNTVDKIVAVEKNEKKVTETGSVKKYRYLEKEVSSE